MLNSPHFTFWANVLILPFKLNCGVTMDYEASDPEMPHLLSTPAPLSSSCLALMKINLQFKILHFLFLLSAVKSHMALLIKLP